MTTKPRPRLQGKLSEHIKDHRISICSNCKFGIFRGHAYKWTAKGLIHIDCNNKAGVNALKNAS